MKLKGRLLYMGWQNLPWKLMTKEGEVNLWPFVDDFFKSIDGKRVKHDQTHDFYMLSSDESSDFSMKYVPGTYIFTEKINGFGFSNIHAYSDHILTYLSGRMIEIDIENGKQIKFSADASEDVFGVYFTSGNSCKVSEGAENTICKIGQNDCCVFLSVGRGGFHCEKFNSHFARMLLDRLAKGNILASRIGNCTVLGRKEECEIITCDSE
ncbi:MAG: hypothetical protein PHX25_01565 [Candidatus Pacebacteria bacterium]|nr:hypothetical protein [Candidatus Paceibacterota bacterium]